MVILWKEMNTVQNLTGDDGGKQLGFVTDQLNFDWSNLIWHWNEKDVEWVG